MKAAVLDEIPEAAQSCGGSLRPHKAAMCLTSDIPLLSVTQYLQLIWEHTTLCLVQGSL